MIRIEAMWLAADPIDMRAGTGRLLARVVQVFGAAQADHGRLVATAGGTRLKLQVHDGFGVWCAARGLNAGRFVWPGTTNATPLLSLTPAQFDASVQGLPWQRLSELSVITARDYDVSHIEKGRRLRQAIWPTSIENVAAKSGATPCPYSP